MYSTAQICNRFITCENLKSLYHTNCLQEESQKIHVFRDILHKAVSKY